MPQFKEVKRLHHPDLEQDVLAWWEAHQVFEHSMAAREGAPTYTFYEGPPTANGRPGIHHVMARTIKDIFCRYKTMKGYQVMRKAGWDTHGLPVEIEVEKQLGLEGRHQVEEYGIAAYNAACRASVQQYTDLWNDLTTRMGYWVDLSKPYVTFRNDYIESVWWLLKQMFDKGLLYKGFKIQWYSPGSNTVLSSHEVSLGYKEVQDPSVYIRFPKHGEANTYFLAWTTTPWTLISNTALAVGPSVDYVKVRHATDDGDEYIILAEARLSVFKDDVEIVERYTGTDLVGLTYEPLFPYFKDDEGADQAWHVVAADYVTTSDGTGIVHTAPAFGAEDYDTAQKVGLPLFNPVDVDGRFTDQAELVAGMWFKDADKVINRHLRERGLLFRQDSYLHNYPHDWRKGTPLMSYPVESWFIRTTALKDRLVELNTTINWQPKGVGTGRFGDWLENNIDWALSRRRYWGTPLPIWVSDADPEYVEMVGSVEELKAKAGSLPVNPETGDIDLHRPFVDDVTWPAPAHVGGTMRRVPDLIDVWFDSGAMPFAQWHYPFENKDIFEQNFPADFIAEGVDQTRGWFYTLHAISTLVMDSVAYKNVVVNGLVLDEKGEKMSKSKGNAVDPFETIDAYGADVVRWYMMSNSPPWENIKFSERGMQETQRKFFGTLSNVYAFFATYANVDGFTYAEASIPVADRAELDRWILSLLASTEAEVDAALDAYNPTKAARAVERFVDDLSNWYIRRSRRRFWSAKEGGTSSLEDKVEAYQTVYESLMAVAKMMAPIAPFYAEWLYQALNGVSGQEPTESVHLALLPLPSTEAKDEALEHRMDLARTISSIVLSLRNESQINVRQPLPRIMVVTGTGVEEEVIGQVKAIILSEVNIKAIEYVHGASDVVHRSAKPNFKRLGKRLGKLMKAVNAKVRALTDEEIEAYLENDSLVLEVNDQKITLAGDDLEISSEGISGWLVGQERGVTVALDTAISDDLLAEGLAREVINRIQNMRKQAGFDVMDRIHVQYDAAGPVAQALQMHAAWVQKETLAHTLVAEPSPEGGLVQAFDLGEASFTLGVTRATQDNGQVIQPNPHESR